MTAGYLAKSVSTIIVVLGVVMAFSGSLQANPVIYEPFADSQATLTGNTPGIGLTGTWSASTAFTVTSGSLTYGTLPTSGNQVAYVSPFGNSASSVGVGPALGAAGLLNDGATLWFSVVVNTPTQGGSNPDTGFALATNALGSGNNLSIGAGGQAIGWTIKSDKLQASTWDGGYVVRGTNGPGVPQNTTIFVVGEITWGANSAAADTINLYLPDTDLNMGSVRASTSAVLNQVNLDTITSSLKTNTGYGFDEIRFGATYEDAIGNPPPPPILTLKVDTVTGATTLLGDAYRAVAINYYEITSAGNSLDAAHWSSLADQDFEGSGPPNGTGNGWGEAGGVGSHALAEAFLLGNSTIGASTSISLGSGYDAFVGAEDLVFTYRTNSGAIVEGLVEYVTSVIAGDANWDGIVDAADYIALKRNFGRATGARYKDGDFNGDHDVDWNDLQTLMGNFGARGVGSAPAAPEPATLGLLALLALSLPKRGALALIRRGSRVR